MESHNKWVAARVAGTEKAAKPRCNPLIHKDALVRPEQYDIVLV